MSIISLKQKIDFSSRNLFQQKKNLYRAYRKSSLDKLLIFIIILCFIDSALTVTYQTPNSILNTSQYHFIPNGSYLQYTFTSANLQINNANNKNQTFSEFTINFQVQISQSNNQSNISYNILVFPQASSQSQGLYQCYVKATIQGSKKIMQKCQYGAVISTQNCIKCYQNALYSQNPTFCLNCQQKNYSISLSSLQWQRLNIWNSKKFLIQDTILTIFDNSPVIFQTGGYFDMILSYNVSLSYNQEYQALFYLFLAIVSAIILILIVAIIFILFTINKVQKNIQQYKNKSKVQ